jgi:hypothetical protein
MLDFDITNKEVLPNDLIEISNNLVVIHFDEFPILYYGTNIFNNKILGSHLDEDDERQRIYCLQTLLTNKQFSDFKNQKKSYRTILEESNSIGLVEKTFNDKIFKVYNINFADIPQEYLPLENSFCPKTSTKKSLNFSLVLKGQLADLNKAVTEVVSHIQDGFRDFIEERIKALKSLQLTSQALLVPSTEGSFRINFEVNVAKKLQQLNLFGGDAPIEKFLADYIQYLTTGFNDEVDLFLDEDVKPSQQFTELFKSYQNLFEKSGLGIPEDGETLLKDDILRSLPNLEKITEQIGKSFEGLEFSNVVTGNEETLSYIDNQFASSFQSSLQQIETSKNEVVTDDDYKEYSIYIYHLNTDSRNGNAWIKDLDNPDLMSKPKIKIDGDAVLEETKYTESLHANKWINVRAKAKKVNNKYVYLNIQFST